MLRYSAPLVLAVLSLVAVDAAAAEVTVVTAPAEDSPEFALRDSLLLMKAGDTKTWVDRWCAPKRCADVRQLEELKAHMLKQAQLHSKNCLHGLEDSLHVKATKGDAATEDKVSITLVCTHKSYPPPAVIEKIDDKWTVTTIPW